jgi:DNA ligase-associated metallophosphoesterase
MEKMIVEEGGEEWMLLSEKCLFWPSQKMLIISDLHLGKSGHFRKSGIPLPLGSDTTDLQRIDKLIQVLSPIKIVFLGDLFHSTYNMEWELFSRWVKERSHLQFVLIEGNHDLLPLNLYHEVGIVVQPMLVVNNIYLSHQEIEHCKGYNMYGHIHPGIRLVGKAKQTIKIPCYLMNEKRMILPAFGSLTGLHSMKPKPAEKVVGIVNQQLINLSH